MATADMPTVELVEEHLAEDDPHPQQHRQQQQQQRFDGEDEPDEGDETLENNVDHTVEVQSLGREMKDYYMQRYKKEWERIPEFKDWLRPVPDNAFNALCRVCNVYLRCHKLKLHSHRLTKKHQKNVERAQLLGPAAVDLLCGEAVALRKPRQSHARSRSTPMRALRPVKRYTEDMVLDDEQETVAYGDSSRVSFSIGLGEHTVGFIGGGDIAKAIAKSMLDKGLVMSSRLWVTSAGTGSLAVWRRWGAVTAASCADLVRACDIVFVAVAAASVAPVLARVGPVNDGLERCIISLVPELTRAQLHQILDDLLPAQTMDMDEIDDSAPSGGESLNHSGGGGGGDTASTSPSYHLIRFTTNLTARTSNGCCAYSADDQLPHKWLLCVEVICGAMGHSCRLLDHQLDAYSAVLCAAPAFTLEFAEALALSGASVAVPWQLARKMVAQTLISVGEMLLNEPDTTALMDEMCPPGSCVVSGLAAMQRGGLRCGMIDAVKASMQNLSGT